MVAQSINEFTENQSGLAARRPQSDTIGHIQKANMLTDFESTALSRDELLAELETFGINITTLDSLPTMVLVDILASFKEMMNAPAHRASRSLRNGSDSYGSSPVLSKTDRKILKTLLTSKGNVSSLTLSKNLDIPLSTVQRRRKRLEANLLEQMYNLKMEKFGLRSATIFVTTSKSSADLIGNEILSWANDVASVKRCIGENSIDLQVDVIFDSNKELLRIMEMIKSIEGVAKVFWSEPVKTIGRNTEIYERVLQS